ncbi:MAG: hypothetical protein ACFFCS_26210, partial [Candidatus Hodarchaeota archaeon]
NAYSINEYYGKYANLYDTTISSQVDSIYKTDVEAMETKGGQFALDFYPEDVSMMAGRRAELGLSVDLPDDLYTVGGGSSREYRMELPGYRILMLRDVDLHLDDDNVMRSWLPLIENYVKMAGFCANNLHIILSDETWIWPCRINDTHYHIDNTILLLAAFDYLARRLPQIKNDENSKKIDDMLSYINEKIDLMNDALVKHYGSDNRIAISTDDLGNPDHSIISNEICRPFVIQPSSTPLKVERDDPKWRKLLHDGLSLAWSSNYSNKMVRSDSKTNALTGNTPGYFLAAAGRTDSPHGNLALEGLLHFIDSTGAVYECHDIYDEFWGTEKRRVWDTCTCLMGVQSYIFGFDPGPEFLEIAPHLPENASSLEFSAYPYKNALYRASMKRTDDGYFLEIQRLTKDMLLEKINGEGKKDVIELLAAMTDAKEKSPSILKVSGRMPWRARVRKDGKEIMLRPQLPATNGNKFLPSWLSISLSTEGITVQPGNWDELDDCEIEVDGLKTNIDHDNHRLGTVNITCELMKKNNAKIFILDDGKRVELDCMEPATYTKYIDINQETARRILDNLVFLTPTMQKWHSVEDPQSSLPGYIFGRLPAYIPCAKLFIQTNDPENKRVYPLNTPVFIVPWEEMVSIDSYPGRTDFESTGSPLTDRNSWWLSGRQWDNKEKSLIILELIDEETKSMIKAEKECSHVPPFWDAWSSLIEDEQHDSAVMVYHDSGSSAAAQLACQELLMLTNKYPSCTDNLEKTSKRMNICLSKSKPAVDNLELLLVDKPLENAAAINVFIERKENGPVFYLWIESTVDIAYDMRALLFRLQTCTQPKRRYAINSYPYGLFLFASLYCVPVTGEIPCTVRIHGLESEDGFTASLVEKTITEWTQGDGYIECNTSINMDDSPKSFEKGKNWLSIRTNNNHVPMEVMAFKGPRARPMATIDVSCDAERPVRLEIELDLSPTTWLVKVDPGDRGQWSRIDDPIKFSRKQDGNGQLKLEFQCGKDVFPLNKVGKQPATARQLHFILARFPSFIKID